MGEPSVVGADWHTDGIEKWLHDQLDPLMLGEESYAEWCERIVAALVPRPTIDRERVWNALDKSGVRSFDGEELDDLTAAVMAVLDPDSEENHHDA